MRICIGKKKCRNITKKYNCKNPYRPISPRLLLKDVKYFLKIRPWPIIEDAKNTIILKYIIVLTIIIAKFIFLFLPPLKIQIFSV